MAALWLGGWRGLSRKAVGQASSATPPTTAAGTGLHYESGYRPTSDSATNECYYSVYTYDTDGRVLSETRTGLQVRNYSYGHTA
jgi:hypothetical protein